MPDNADYYKTLGIAEDASEKQIKDAYRRLAFQYHPDRNPDTQSSAKMRAVNEAYAVLSNPAKRRDYDAVRRQFGSDAYSRFRSAYTESDIYKGSDIHRVFEEMAASFGFRSFEEIFKEAYGKGYGSFEFKRPGFSARGFVFTGGPRKGRSARVGNPPVFAEKVSRYFIKKFTGVDLPERGADVRETLELTPQEARDGGFRPFFYRKKAKKLMVNVPPGLKEGRLIRLAGMGDEGKGGGTPGDLYLRVKIRKQLREKIKGFLDSLRGRVGFPRP